ncbi:hypothetical protein AB6A40_002003 [Gnathostoma spinigerum]|uniref:Uncharacterized protein n=1 Tax=Gnathostoma spinigerum TaxID=75299 RepID=A0ABD6EAX8_9BILA
MLHPESTERRRLGSRHLARPSVSESVSPRKVYAESAEISVAASYGRSVDRIMLRRLTSQRGRLKFAKAEMKINAWDFAERLHFQRRKGGNPMYYIPLSPGQL